MSETSERPYSVVRCGGRGSITPDAQRELDAFADHLKTHRGHDVDGCRFCAERRRVHA